MTITTTIASAMSASTAYPVVMTENEVTSAKAKGPLSWSGS